MSAEIREVPLPDGTRMTLDTSTSVAVVMGRDLRHVRLRGGRARFAVAPDGRPFLIEAGPGRVSGSNARFDVALGRRGAAVHALEGVVSVMPPGAASGNRKILLAPGQAVAIPAASGGVEALPSSGSATKWPEGMLEFDNTPLDAAVAEANRYSETRISLAQPSLAQLRVSGTFRAGDLEGLARSLGTAFGLHVERRGARQLVLTEVGSGRRAGDPRKKKGGVGARPIVNAPARRSSTERRNRGGIMFRQSLLRHAGAAALAAALAVQSASAYGQTTETQTYDLAAQDLAQALKEVAARSGLNLVMRADLVAGRRSPALLGSYTPQAALEALLAGSGLVLRTVGNSFVVTAGLSDEAAAEDQAGRSDIVVTGTRIRGAGPVGSNLILLDRRDIERTGHATTQDILRTIPQNFGGGPNEATGAVSLDPNAGRNVSLGSSLNLRGLGNASTLILLNGDRPPLGGFGGVFSDLSLIPASAVERIEILADGTSAIYGSDAVAGVVNVIPRLRFDGVESSLRFGTADGDAAELLASQLVGQGWGSGHAVLAYEFYRRSALPASERDFITDDLRDFGGPDLRSPYANPATYWRAAHLCDPARPERHQSHGRGLLADTVNRADSWDMVDVLRCSDAIRSSERLCRT
jgi:ferric-dicitrate binding protein FerR (iron transport regulator)